jgi:hypothetical protein
MNIDLNQLPLLQKVFKKLNSGCHVNRLEDTEIWIDLEKNQPIYETLFAALGFTLIVDLRSFAYFKSDSASSHTSKITRRLGLFLLLLFEYQADNGLHLFQFQQWQIDTILLNKLCQHHYAIFEIEEMATLQNLKDILESASRLGFVMSKNGDFQLLPAAHRYLDLFEELAEANRENDAKIEVIL